MASLNKKIKRLYSEKGLSGLVEAMSFTFLARCFHVPSRKIAVFNGIAVRGASFYSKEDIFPKHEDELISAIRNYVKNGEKVILIGGGSGASTVVVAHQVGKNGSVITYEANRNSFARTKETINLNQVDDRVEIYHAIIEKPVYLVGELGDPPLIPTKDFSECDVLVMDCEGAEIPILQNLQISPRLIIVEAHPLLNSPKEEVIKLLDKLGYEIISSDSRGESLDVLSAIKKIR